MSGPHSVDELADRGRALVESARRRDTQLRLVGSLACRLHCQQHTRVLDELGRDLPGDLDFVAEAGSVGVLREVFGDAGFEMDERVAQESGREQLFFVHRGEMLGADVYVRRLNYCHPLDLAGRLAADPWTIPLAELLLAKLQIVEITDKDLKDIAVLLLEHPFVEGSDDDTINATRVVDILRDDWGFCHTVSINLSKLEFALERYDLQPETRAAIRKRADELSARMSDAPKTRKWKMRSRVGTKIRWFQEVEAKPNGV